MDPVDFEAARYGTVDRRPVLWGERKGDVRFSMCRNPFGRRRPQPSEEKLTILRSEKSFYTRRKPPFHPLRDENPDRLERADDMHARRTILAIPITSNGRPPGSCWEFVP
jgi:hypothetical protein